MRIADQLAMQKMQEQQAQQPVRYAPTEKAQIVILYTEPRPSSVARFNKVKDGRKMYDAMVKAWSAYSNWSNSGDGPTPDRLFDVSNDMWIGVIDLQAVAGICFVDHIKRSEFVPIPE